MPVDILLQSKYCKMSQWSNMCVLYLLCYGTAVSPQVVSLLPSILSLLLSPSLSLFSCLLSLPMIPQLCWTGLLSLGASSPPRLHGHCAGSRTLTVASNYCYYCGHVAPLDWGPLRPIYALCANLDRAWMYRAWYSHTLCAGLVA